MQKNKNEQLYGDENEKTSSMPFGEFASEESENKTEVGEKKGGEKENFVPPLPEQVTIIGENYENPMEQRVKEYRNADKKRCLIFALLGLFSSIFYVGVAFSITSIVLSIPLIKREKKSTLLKWSVFCNVCAVIIEAILIFTRLYFA